MNGERDEPGEPDAAGAKAPSPLRVVRGGPLPGDAPEQPPLVRLRREFKGLTVTDLMREDVAARLPGQVRSAIEHLERGDLAAAERALPGRVGAVLEGPGHRANHRWGWFAIVGVAAIALGVVLSRWLVG